jgi:elongator complex protein 4
MSFRKFKDSKVIKGTRISTLNLKVLTSTGIASLDEIIGGGIPIGTVLMLKQDRYTGYANLILKYFIAQGIAHEHQVMFVSFDTNPEEYISDLMGILSGKQESTQDDEEDIVPQSSARTFGALRNTKMEIAWRYQRLPQLSTISSSDFRGPNSKLVFDRRHNLLSLV